MLQHALDFHSITQVLTNINDQLVKITLLIGHLGCVGGIFTNDIRFDHMYLLTMLAHLLVEKAFLTCVNCL